MRKLFPVLVIGLVVAGAFGQDESVELSNGLPSGTDGHLLIQPDLYGAYTNWGWFGTPAGSDNKDNYNPAGALGVSQPMFAGSFFFYVPATQDKVVFGTPFQDLDVTYNFGSDPGTMMYAPINQLAASDCDGDNVDDTATSSWNANGGNGGYDLDFELEQQVLKPATGSAVATFLQTLTITNNGNAGLTFLLDNHKDWDLIWDGNAEDVAGSINNGGTIDPYTREADGDPNSPSLVSHTADGPHFYTAGKSGFDPDGAGPDPAFAFGTDFQIWGALGLPMSWRNHTAGVGPAPATGEVMGQQPAGSATPFDTFNTIEHEITLAPGASTTIEYITTYGSNVPTGATCGGGCVGDLDGDGDTDLADLGILLADFGCTAPGPCPGDLDGDGDTDLADLGILLADFGCT